MLVPRSSSDPWVLTDIESLLSLVLTEGWRAEGWIPLHAAAVVRFDTCALICAESGGGKTSLTAALVREGWQTLGDDKLLLRITHAAQTATRADERLRAQRQRSRVGVRDDRDRARRREVHDVDASAGFRANVRQERDRYG